MTVRVRVDGTRCAGHGICALLLPGVVELDPWGFARADPEPVEGRDLARARRAAAACPRRAVVLVAEASPGP